MLFIAVQFSIKLITKRSFLKHALETIWFRITYSRKKKTMDVGEKILYNQNTI